MIKFHTIYPDLLAGMAHPAAASKFLPKYFKDMQAKYDSHPASMTVKRCVPFLEAMTGGFIIPMWADLYVNVREDGIDFNPPPIWTNGQMVQSHNSQQVEGNPYAEERFGMAPFKFMSPWVVETPPGWSCLFTAPQNHGEQRFTLFSGTVDTDTYYSAINFPFIWRAPVGEYLIKKGTPLVQVLPVKREVMQIEVGAVDAQREKDVNAQIATSFADGYRNNFWHKNADKP